MKKNKSQKSYLKILLIILAAVILFDVGYFGWNFYQSKKQAKAPVNNQLQTYSLPYWGVSFQYPDNYLVENNDGGIEGAYVIKILNKETKKWEQEQITKCQQKPGDSSCGVYDALYTDGLVMTTAYNPQKLSLNDWFTKNITNSYSKKSLEINGLTAIENTEIGLDGTSIYIADTNNNIYKLSRFSSKDPVFNQIINSFKIIK